MSKTRKALHAQVTETLEAARYDRGDWLAAMEMDADDLATAGEDRLSNLMNRALRDARADSHDDWLAMIEMVADGLK